MAIVTYTENNTATLKINIGVDADGKRKTKNINIAGMKNEAFTTEDKQKLHNIATALAPLLNHSLYSISLTQRETIDEE